MILTSSWIVDFLLFSSVGCFLIYKYVTRHFSYWKKRGVYYPQPIPFFGNFYDVLTLKTTIQEHMKKYWDKTDAPYFGMFILDEPVLVLKSPKLIKDVLVKDFSVFCDRRVATPTHPKMIHSVFFQKYNPWKKIRSKLSPLFTSVMMKNMHVHLEQINSRMTDFINNNTGELDVRSIGGHFATEMIARCFYGVNIFCFDEEKSLFRKHVHEIADFNVRNAVIQNLFFLKPKWITLFKLNFIQEDIMDFFHGVLQYSITSRPNNGNKIENLADLANKALQDKETGKADGVEMETVVSNAIFFLIAGQETTSTIISFTLYELAMNQKLQDKLRESIEVNVEKHGGLTYEGIQDNKYMDMCIKETMRKYPALPFLDRMPVRDYKLEGTDLVIEKGTSVIIPFFALHRDEKYYPEPEKYIPERFEDETINSDGLTFIPFGEGPRKCLGRRLGMIAVAMALSNVISLYRVEKCSKTPETIEFEPKNFALLSKVGLPLKITAIVKNTNKY